MPERLSSHALLQGLFTLIKGKKTPQGVKGGHYNGK
jgi:hypothetical protein